MICKNPNEMRQSYHHWKKAYELSILLILLMCLAFLPWADAQTISRQSINSFGGSSNAPNMEHTAGEAVIFTRSQASVILSQGYHQTYTMGFVGSQEFVIDRFGISLFPNPTNSTLNIGYSNGSKSNNGLRLSVYNCSGQLVLSDADILKSSSEIYQLNIANLSSGIYYIHLSNGSFQSNHKIIKTN